MTRNRQELIVQLTEDIMKLAKPFNHTEQNDGKAYHSKHGSLLDQLRDELTDSTPPTEGSGSRPSPASKPPVREEISALLWEAEMLARTLVKENGGKLRYEADENFLQLPSLLQHQDDEALSNAVDEIASLRRRINTQLTWELRPRRLVGPCPACEAKGTVVVQLDTYGPTRAECQACRIDWDKSQLGLLAGQVGGKNV